MPMMKNTFSNSPACKLYPYEKIVGKWHHNEYAVIRELGSGARGTVYLVQSKWGRAALKVGDDPLAITSEVNVLKHFSASSSHVQDSKVQDCILGPSLLDVDDFVMNGKTYPFYVMEYIHGKGLLHYMKGRHSEWLGILIIQLLRDLSHLHQAGWVFGDLKQDNIIVTNSPARIRWIDVGGTTLLGRSIKEYTEFYDRGYWELGLRKAEPSYDLFSVAMMMVHCAYPNYFQKETSISTLQLLKNRIEGRPLLRPYRNVLYNAIQGKYKTAHHMRSDMIRAVEGATVYNKRRREKKKKPSYFVEMFLVISFLLLLYILYLFR